jgi:hypothetical protein
MAVKKSTLKDLFSDRFSDIWRLLSETSQFLSRTPIFGNYENQLREWRLELQSNRQDPELNRQIRLELTELRRSLRLQGYDLSLAGQQLVFEGFRNDASMGEGFKRVVLFFTDEDIYWISGDSNHIALADMLETRISGAVVPIRSKHYLWYMRRGKDLVLSGSDTETKENFERLKAMGEAHSLIILGKLRGLK